MAAALFGGLAALGNALAAVGAAAAAVLASPVTLVVLAVVAVVCVAVVVYKNWDSISATAKKCYEGGKALVGAAATAAAGALDNTIRAVQLSYKKRALAAKANAPPKKRSAHPPARRVKHKSKKAAREAAKKDGKGKKPIHHPDGDHGPHYHPDVGNPKTPKAPSPHDHHYYPK